LSERLANGGSLPQSSGTAWAGITAPGAGPVWDTTAVEARVDPTQDQTKLGTSLSKSLPLNQQYSLSLQNGYDLIEQGVVPVPALSDVRRAITKPISRRSSVSPTPAPVSPPASRSPPPTTNGCARSAPSRSCSAASAFRARSAKPRSAPPTRVSPPGSSKAGSGASNRVKDRALPQIGPDAAKIDSPDGSTSTFVVRGTIRARLTRNRGTTDERHHSF
jgi:hypothetical protein